MWANPTWGHQFNHFISFWSWKWVNCRTLPWIQMVSEAVVNFHQEDERKKLCSKQVWFVAVKCLMQVHSSVYPRLLQVINALFMSWHYSQHECVQLSSVTSQADTPNSQLLHCNAELEKKKLGRFSGSCQRSQRSLCFCPGLHFKTFIVETPCKTSYATLKVNPFNVK